VLKIRLSGGGNKKIKYFFEKIALLVWNHSDIRTNISKKLIFLLYTHKSGVKI
jgi:hypothetical protein